MGGRPRHLRSEEVMFLRMFRSDAAIKQLKRCAYCTEPLKCDGVTGDHIMPRSAGGSTTRKNISACCGPCNRSKGAMSVRAFVSAIQNPAPGAPMHILLAHIRWRLSSRTWEACGKIRRAVGMPADVGRF